MMWRTVIALLLACLTGPVAEAHERSRSSSSWQIDADGARGVFLLEARQATLFLSVYPDGTSLEAAYRARLVEGIALSRGGEACTLAASPLIRLLPDGRLRADMDWSCERNTGDLAFDIRVFSPFSPNHVHFLSVQAGDAVPREFLLSRNRTTARLTETGAASGGQTGLLGFMRLGIEHISGGLDHLAFLAALLLIVGGWRSMLLVTLGFTLGHSITLALAVFGWINPPGSGIEALIGFSIVFVAGEAALKGRSVSRRLVIAVLAALGLLALIDQLVGEALPPLTWAGLLMVTGCYLAWLRSGGQATQSAPAMSTGFGLVHGVGFAGILLEIDLPRETLFPALLGFNIGVEIGQILFVGLVLAGLALLRPVFKPDHVQLARSGAIAVLAGLGMFWFVARSLA